MRNNSITWRLLLLMGLLTLAAPGCIFSPDEGGNDDPGGGGQDYVWPSTPEKLMQNFQTAYTRMDIDGYRDLLNEEHFKFFFLQGEGPDAFWGFQDDVQSTANLFSGDPPPNPRPGETNRGITEITVDELLETEPWENVSAVHPYFGDISGAQRSVYSVRFILKHDDGTITVRNSQVFFAAPREVTQEDGTTKTRWEIIGQEELPI